MNATRGCVVGAMGLCAGTALAGFYSDEASFYADVDVVHVAHFDEVVAGSSGDLSYTSGAYSYTISVVGDGDQTLDYLDGVVRTSSSGDKILLTFTGAEVTAVGGNMWGIDEEGGLLGGYLTFELDDGSVNIYSATGPHNFRGFSSSSAIHSVLIDVPDASYPIWTALDNLAIGTLPTPGACSLLGVASLSLARRRR